MLTVIYDYDSEKQLSATEIDRLVQLIGISNTFNVDEFLSKPDDDHNLYNFIDFLANNQLFRNISSGWKWEPDDILQKAALIFPNHTIEFTQLDTSQATNFYSIRFKIDDIDYQFEVLNNRLEQFIEYIEKIINDGQFMEVNFYDDPCYWWCLPHDFSESDFREFCSLTGCRPYTTLPLEQRMQKLSIIPVGKQSTKIFFKPKIQIIAGNSGRELPVDWSGRVLPGQTIQEGIASELEQVLNYKGRFEYSDIYFHDYVKDRQGNDIEQYGVYLTLYPASHDELPY